ncbi:hypothetical protein [Accumulibacter sp.]|uniref:hypothetical protein n=1 Tax=Accumulibacter sp. TaxID=2053492 RepID=UPI002601D3F2|nr:hypothetical protein [Accumulibacter sp.]
MRVFIADLALGVVINTPCAEALPPAPVELGSVRRNEQGQLEVVKPPPDRPSAVTRDSGATPSGIDGPNAGPDKTPTAQAASGRTIVVGPNEPIGSLKEAARMARDGDTIEILPGEYRRQAVVWGAGRVTIRGRGKRPVFLADGDSAEDKALWVVRNADMLIENIEIRGVRVRHGNGAGIRLENGQLRIVRCAFLDNEMGILTGNDPTTVLDIEDSEFGQAPKHSGALHHLLYAGTIARLSVRGSRFEQGFRGHLIKSRARESFLFYNMIVDGEGGRASYEVEFPNGGLAWMIGNIVGQSASTENPDLISYGAEGRRWPENGLYLAHNTLLDEHHGGRFLRLWSDRLPPETEVWAINNLVVGPSTFSPLGPGRYDGNQTAERSLLSNPDGQDFSLPSNSRLRGTARPPGSVRERSLLPVAEFRLPAGTRALASGKPLSPGALQ